MDPVTTARWFGYSQALENRFFLAAGVGIGALLLIALMLTTVLLVLRLSTTINA